jgi:hypothetical protein
MIMKKQKSPKKHLKILPFNEDWAKNIEVVSLDGGLRFFVDYDDVEHTKVKKRLKELIKVYNLSLEEKHENGNKGDISDVASGC